MKKLLLVFIFSYFSLIAYSQCPDGVSVVISSHTNVNCNGNCNGSATATASGGVTPYTYSWSPSGGTSSTATALCANTYTITVTDNKGCTATASVNITQPTPLVVSIISSNGSNCGSCNGTASASASGGTAPYNFSWSPKGGNKANATGLCSGYDTVTVTDANGCTATAAVFIDDINLTTTLTSTDLTCNGVCNGSASVTVTGGTIPYTYSWSPTGGNGSTATALCAGTYTVFVSDKKNCITEAIVTITQPPAIVINTSTTQVTCKLNNGSATANVSGGTGAYTYSWSPGGGTTATITGLSIGTYTVTVHDANSCSGTSTATITDNTTLTVSMSSTNVTCNGNCDGTATANTSGGVPPYTYSWSPSGGTNATASNLCPNTYTVTVTDNNGCIVTLSVTITQPAKLTGSTSSTSSFCGDSNGTAQIVVSGGTPSYTYFWSNGATTSSLTGLSAGTYIVSVYDSNGCNINAAVTVANSSPIVTTISSKTNVSCNGACDGSATVSATGGTLPYTYHWSNGQTTSTATSLCAGTFTVNVMDANGCSTPALVVITQPTAIRDSVKSVTYPKCNGGTGSASIGVKGGTPPYTYSWSPGGYTTATVSTLSAGTYTVTITDNHGCSKTLAVTITQPPPIIVTTTVTPTTCGNNNGTASASASGGKTPYTYLWSPGGQTTTTITGLSIGTYTITVTDSNGCTGSATATITPIAQPTVTISSTNLKCNGDSSGSATANVSGGTSPYTYLWNPGGKTTATITGLSAGTYTVNVQDANGCTTSATVTITQPTKIIASISGVNNVQCNGGNNGSVTVTGSGGTSPYTYLWNPGGNTNATVSNLTDGTYTVTVTDNNGCSATVTITITQPPTPLSIAISQTNVNCNGNCNGTATATVTGGSPAYTYNWSNGATTSSISSLCPGAYKIVVTDNHGCKDSANVTITQPPSLTIAISQNNITCNGNCNGSATATVSGGTPAYTYKWSNGATTSSISSLCAGVYKIVVTDANGCKDSVNATITQPTAITITVSQTNVTCNGSCNGSATATVSGGTPAYIYKWSNGATTSSISSLCAGVYKIVVTDANGCKDSTNVTITQPTALAISKSQTNPTCNGNCNGTATATVTGGTPVYTYKWSTGATTSSISNLCAGVYKIVVTDANGCKDSANVTITQPAGMTLTTTNTNVTCNGNCIGTATVTVTGGTSPYTYKWSTGATTTNVSNLCAGVYKIVVTDKNGCKDSANVTITQPNPLILTTSQTNVKCKGDCNGTATATVSGGNPAYTYKWSNGATTSSISSLCAGVYKIVVTDANGCKDSLNVTITQPANALAIVTSQTNVSCNGSCNGTATATVSGGTPVYTYKWSTGATTSSISSLCAGVYKIVVTDNNGCKDSANVTITQPTPLSITTIQTNVPCTGNCIGSASATVTGGSPAYTYKWSNGATTSSISSLCAGVYKLVVTDNNGCKDSVNVTITSPTPIVITTSQTNITCTGNCNGTATATVSGGAPPYTYKWSTGATTSSISSLCAGVYKIVVTDNNGCKDSVNVTITQPANGLSISTSQANVSCNGSCNGSAIATVTGGTPAYTYKWSTGATTSSISSLCAGVYKIVVTDKNGCKDSANVTITQPAPLVITTSQTNVLCNGDCNGTASATVSGGTAPYTYKWNTGATTTSISGLCPGTSRIVVTDANGCKDSADVIITQPTPLSITTSQTNVTCNGNCNGTASVTASGGTPAYTYKWSNGATTSSVSNLCAGVYKIVVTDNNGCKDSANITITQPTGITITITNTNETCNGNCNGSATATVSGGSPAYTYKWSNGATTSSISSLCAGVYKIVVTDANGCKDSANVTITQPTALSITTSQTNATCNGNCNGTATATVTGGTPAYIYKWSTGATSSSISNLCAGVYKIVVTDANGCKDSANVTITQPAPIIITTSQTNVSCNGSCNGTASATASGGAAPYTYKWSTGATSTSINNLCAGTYTIVVTDNNGCKDSTNVTITQPAPIVITTSQTNLSCNSNCNGSATATVSGGTPVYTYKWSTGATTSSVSSLCTGVYKIVVTDANGCKDSATVTITQPTGITIITTNTNEKCNGDCNGTANATPSGGTPVYTYKWSNGATTSSISNLCAGVYTIKITDANGCKDSVNVTLTQPTPISIITSQTNVTCNGNCDGTASAIISGGTPVYTYLWSTGATTTSISNLCVGGYKLVVTDNNGCKDSISVTITQPNPLIISIAQTNVSCTGNCNGTATATVLGGTPAYTYKWSTGATTSSINNLCAGAYKIVVTDANGCKDSMNLVITQPAFALAVTSTNTNVTCNGNCDGTATAIATGGTPSYTYKWSNGQTTSTANNLCAGNYTVVVTDANGCKDSVTTITVTQPSAIRDSITAFTNISCNGGNDGSATVGVKGGTLPYTYSWSPSGGSNATASNLTVGTYTITITDANGCTSTVSVTLTQPPPISITFSQTNVTCNGDCNGTATANASGGSLPYTFTWSNGQTTQTATGLCAGSYTVTVTDNSGCSSTALVNITTPAPLNATITSNKIFCNNSCDGIAIVHVTGGTSPYTYTVSNGLSSNTYYNDTLTNLCPGTTYTVTITDSNKCTFIDSVFFVNPPAIAETHAVTNSSCNNMNDGSITITVSGGTPQYTYQWSNGSTTQNLSNILSGIYTLTIKDSAGCSITDTIIVPSNKTVIANAGRDTSVCANTIVLLNGDSSINSLTYKWLQMPGLNTISDTSFVTVSPSVTTTYILIVSNGGCSDTSNVTITIIPPIPVDAGPTQYIIPNQSVTIGGSPTGPNGSTYLWQTGFGLSDSIIANPVASPSVTTTYTVFVTNPNGCPGSDTVTVFVVPHIVIPDGFSPNGDGQNDVWNLGFVDNFPGIVVEVFNRWGELLFRSVGYKTPWDGTYNGKPVPVGTYYYVINLHDPRFTQSYTGPVTILR